MCSKVLINAGFRYIYWLTEYRDTQHLQIFTDLGICSGNYEKLIDDYHTLIVKK